MNEKCFPCLQHLEPAPVDPEAVVDLVPDAVTKYQGTSMCAMHAWHVIDRQYQVRKSLPD